MNTYNSAPANKENRTYPIIIYSPGLGMNRDMAIFNIEQFVNAGYIVFTLGHIYDTEFTILPNGEVIEQAAHIIDGKLEARQQLLDIRKKDIIFLMDELKVLNENDEYIKGMMDLNKIGVIGHSIGGTAVFRVATEDSRIKAVIMLDGSLQYFNLIEDIKEGKRLSTPLLNFRRGSIGYDEEMKKTIKLYADHTNGEEFKERIIMRDQTLIGQIEGQKQLYQYLSGYKSFIKLKNSGHMTFTDWPIIFNQEMENEILPIKEAHQTINEATIRFFNEFLCNKDNEFSKYIDSCSSVCIMDENGEKVKYQ